MPNGRAYLDRFQGMIEGGDVAAEFDAGSPGSGGASPHPAPGLLSAYGVENSGLCRIAPSASGRASIFVTPSEGATNDPKCALSSRHSAQSLSLVSHENVPSPEGASETEMHAISNREPILAPSTGPFMSVEEKQLFHPKAYADPPTRRHDSPERRPDSSGLATPCIPP
jgi:hypothetical protein